MPAKASPSTPAPGDLGRLVETEQRLESRLKAAREEGERLVVAAREAAQAGEARLDAEVEDLHQRLQVDADAERRSRIGEIEQASQAEIAAFDGVDAATLAGLARHVVKGVVSARAP